jgi:hypothetical protein
MTFASAPTMACWGESFFVVIVLKFLIEWGAVFALRTGNFCGGAEIAGVQILRSSILYSFDVPGLAWDDIFPAFISDFMEFWAVLSEHLAFLQISCILGLALPCESASSQIAIITSSSV